MNRITKSLAFPLLLAATLLQLSGCGSRAKYPRDRYIIRMETSKGDMILELYNETPLHRDNFVQLARKGFYDGTAFHRIIPNFMVQGGDPETRNMHPDSVYGTHDAGYTIPPEFVDTLYHLKGALAAARSGDDVNPEKNSSGSQFYIVEGKRIPSDMLRSMELRHTAARRNAFANRVARSYYDSLVQQKPKMNREDMVRRIDSVGQAAYLSVPEFFYADSAVHRYETLGGAPHLDGDYTVYGRVIEGLNVLDSIAHVPTGKMDRPIDKILIKKVLVIQVPKKK